MPHTHRHTYRHADTETDRHADTETDRHEDTETDTETDRQTDISQKYWNRVQDIPKRVNPSKVETRKFEQNQYFLHWRK